MAFASLLQASLSGLTYTANLVSETTNSDGHTVFEIAYSISNQSSFHIESGTLEIESSLSSLLTEPENFDLPNPFRYFGIPLGITATGQSDTIICGSADTTLVRNRINAQTTFEPAINFGIAGFRYAPLDLSIAAPTLLSETAQPDGRIKLDFTLSQLSNSGNAQFVLILIELDHLMFSPFTIEADGPIQVPFIGSNATLSDTYPYSLLVEASDKDAIIALVTNGDSFQINASEAITNEAPNMPIDEETALLFTGLLPLTSTPVNPFTARFSSNSPFLSRLQIGHRLRDGAGTLDFLSKLRIVDDVESFTPQYFTITAIETVGSEIHLTGNREDISANSGFAQTSNRMTPFDTPGAFRATDSILITSTDEKPFETNFPPDTAASVLEYLQRENSTQEETFRTRDEQIADYLSAFNATPYIFDDFEIIPGVLLNGQIFLQAIDVDFEIAWREEEANQFTARYTARFFANLVVETRGGADNRDEPDLSKVSTLIDVNFPGPTLPVGPLHTLNIFPSLKIDIGADVFLPGKSTIPIQTGIIAGGEMTYHNGSFSSRAINDSLPPNISKAEVQEALQAQVNLSLDSQLGLGFAITSVDAGLFPLLSGSLDFGARIDTSFFLDPLGSPWWSLDGELSITAAANLESFLTPLISEETDLGGAIPLFSLDAGGPFTSSGGTGSSQNSPNNLSPELGDDLRWSTVLETNKPTVSGDPHIETLPNNCSLVFTPTASPFEATFTKLDENGATLWSLGLASLQPELFTVLPDGSAILASEATADEIALTKIDSSGQILWNTSHEFDLESSISLEINGIASTEESGSTVIYLCGQERISRTPILFKFDQNGQPLFHQRYPSTESSNFTNLTVANNGDLLVVGESLLQPSGTPFRTTNGLLARISSDGTFLWGRFTWSQSTNQNFDICEDPATGDIYTVGQHFGTIRSPHTGIQVCKWTSDGDLFKRIILEPEIDDLSVDAFNRADSCFFAHNSLYLGGELGLGNESRFFLSRLSDQLGTLFFTSFSSPFAEGTVSLSPSSEGFLIAFNSASSNPWGGNGSTTNSLGSGAHTIISHVPWEGFFRLHPLTGIQPRVHRAYSFGTFDILDTQVNLPINDQEALHVPGLFSRLQQGEFNLTTSADPTSPDLSVIGSAEEIFDHPFDPSLPFILTTDTGRALAATNITLQVRDASDLPETAITSYTDWEDFHSFQGIEGGQNADPDEDGINNIMEAFIGTNPLQENSEDFLTLNRHPETPGDFQLRYPISSNAAFLTAFIQRNETLPDLWENWVNAAPTFPPTGSPPELGLIDFTPDEEQEFFRLRVTLPN